MFLVFSFWLLGSKERLKNKPYKLDNLHQLSIANPLRPLRLKKDSVSQNKRFNQYHLRHACAIQPTRYKRLHHQLKSQ
jgi:hypothetical protein